ncbi:MAG TPA: YIP1 family protein, partial [Anaerolineae bacterium]
MFMDRVMGVFRLNPNTFEEIEADRDATTQAALVVLIVALIAAIGSGIGATIAEDGNFIGSFVGTIISTFVGWIVWSAITYFVGTSFFGGQADLGEMLRVIGFAYAPQVLGIIPCIGTIIGFIWSLV